MIVDNPRLGQEAGNLLRHYADRLPVHRPVDIDRPGGAPDATIELLDRGAVRSAILALSLSTLDFRGDREVFATQFALRNLDKTLRLAAGLSVCFDPIYAENMTADEAARAVYDTSRVLAAQLAGKATAWNPAQAVATSLGQINRRVQHFLVSGPV